MDTLDTSLNHPRGSLVALPLAILFAGIVLAFAVYEVRNTIIPGEEGNVALVRPVDDSDHIVGSPSAPVKIIEYADIDSRYSKDFQRTLEQAMTTYAAGGKVAWVYRHFPTATDNGGSHAEAAECAASAGGPQQFYRFIDALQAAAPDDNQFNPQNYDIIVSSLGISTGAFEQCRGANTFAQKIADDAKNAIEVGAQGAPYSVLLVHGQPPVGIAGAIPYDALTKIFDESIKKAGAAN